MTRRVQVQYFAVLREQAGLAAETVATSATSPRELYDELRATRGLALPQAMLRVAVNEEFCGWEHPLAEGDRVVFIPPVAGG
jgi:molybdopterin converting factor subunit 1